MDHEYVWISCAGPFGRRGGPQAKACGSVGANESSQSRKAAQFRSGFPVLRVC